MLELRNDRLIVHSRDVHPDATTGITMMRTLRIPDDDRDHPLPAGLGAFPVRHVADLGDRAPDAWRARGGVVVPMWSTEAMWLRFEGRYPYALKIAAGKRCAITGRPFSMDLHDDEQDYVVVPGQRWLDGFAIAKGIIRQFVAMRLGEGYTVEEQLSGTAEWGGLQIVAHPMRAEAWEAMEEARRAAARSARRSPAAGGVFAAGPMPMPMAAPPAPAAAPTAPDMGMAAGGRMRQEIRPDRHGLEAWAPDAASRVYVHLCDAQVWRHVTGEEPPTVPPTAAEYEAAGIPWFEGPADGEGLPGGSQLGGVASVAQIGEGKGAQPYADNAPIDPGTVIPLSPHAVSDGTW